MELLGLVGRVTLSLVVVLTLLWLAARGLRKNQRRTLGGIEMDVLARQPLAQKASLAVVRLGDRALVLGVTEGRIELLSEQPLDSLLVQEQPEAVDGVLQDVAVAQPGASVLALPGRSTRRAGSATSRPESRGRLDGSALSPKTWSKALDAVRELTVRR